MQAHSRNCAYERGLCRPAVYVRKHSQNVSGKVPPYNCNTLRHALESGYPVCVHHPVCVSYYRSYTDRNRHNQHEAAMHLSRMHVRPGFFRQLLLDRTPSVHHARLQPMPRPCFTRPVYGPYLSTTSTHARLPSPGLLPHPASPAPPPHHAGAGGSVTSAAMPRSPKCRRSASNSDRAVALSVRGSHTAYSSRPASWGPCPPPRLLPRLLRAPPPPPPTRPLMSPRAATSTQLLSASQASLLGLVAAGECSRLRERGGRGAQER